MYYTSTSEGERKNPKTVSGHAKSGLNSHMMTTRTPGSVIPCIGQVHDDLLSYLKYAPFPPPRQRRGGVQFQRCDKLSLI